MTLTLITATIGVISIIFCLLSVKLLYRYIHKYRFDETKYTLLFGFLRLRYIAILYVVITVGLAVGSTLFVYYVTL
ncbi:hypothetical protein ACFL3T_00005 [Patescibacteria group bacterium]